MSKGTVKELKSETVELETTNNESGSYCPTDRVESVTQTDDDTLSSIETTILYKNAKHKDTFNQTSIPTHRSFIVHSEKER